MMPLGGILGVLEHAHKTISVFTALVLTLGEGKAWFIRVLYFADAAIVVFNDRFPVSRQFIDPAASLRRL